MRRRLWSVYAICGAGALLRVLWWARGLPLRMDEAKLGLNLLERSPVGLLSPLDYGQAAPIGFLVPIDLTVSMLGPTEPAMRLVPLLAGVAGLCLFARLLVERFGLGALTLLGVAALAFLPTHVLQSANLKPYTLDLAVTCLLLLVWHRNGSSWQLLAVGAIAPWFSFSSVFVLVGLGVWWLFREWQSSLLAGAAWLASFGVYWMLILRETAGREGLAAYWQDAFAPGAVGLLPWMAERWLRFFEQPAWFVVPLLAAAFAIAGLWRLSQEGGGLSLIVVVAALALVGASAFGRYPVSSRLLFSFVPLALIAVMWGAVGDAGRWALVAMVAIGAVASARHAFTLEPVRDYRSFAAGLHGSTPDGTAYIHHLADEGVGFYVERSGSDLVWRTADPEAGQVRDGAWLVRGRRWTSESDAYRDRFDAWLESHNPFCDTIASEGLTAYRACSTTP